MSALLSQLEAQGEAARLVRELRVLSRRLKHDWQAIRERLAAIHDLCPRLTPHARRVVLTEVFDAGVDAGVLEGRTLATPPPAMARN